MQDKVLLILVDGMRPDSILPGGGPEFEQFFRSGTYSLQGSTVFPPVTLPCHMSLFHSVDPDRHGVTTNVFVPQNHPIDGMVDLLYAARKRTAFFYTWEQLRDLTRPGKSLHYSWFLHQRTEDFPQLEQRETQEAKRYIQEFEPDFVFLYLGGVDEVGHKYGWMSEPYLKEVGDVAACIADICASLPESYNVIVTADHGGHDRNHGDRVPEDMIIPTTFHGRRFPAGLELPELSIRDIAPTIMDLLNVPICPDWEGSSVLNRIG